MLINVKKKQRFLSDGHTDTRTTQNYSSEPQNNNNNNNNNEIKW